jgi:alkylation response protein AidB-like acyl-CoA dehydrogenase
LPAILAGEVHFAIGYSEPGAGTDLASLSTRAVRDGDEYVINGQKIWTTGGHDADWVWLACRTDPDAPKHKGISYLLCPMNQPGVEVRPINQIDGAAEFAEVFFTDARCPVDNVVGGLNNGWAVAMTTLGFERGSSATTGHRRFETELNHIIELARANGRIDDPLVRQGLARCYSKVQIMKVNGLRSLAAVLSGKRDAGVAALGATNKMFWSEYHQQVMKLAMDILGMESQILLGDPSAEESVPGYGRRRTSARYPANALQSSFFFSRSETIWGGTSQIQRNIVGERVLGLPKEPKVAT